MRDQTMITPDSGNQPINVTATDLYIHGDGGWAPSVEQYGAIDWVEDTSLPYAMNPIDENFQFDIAVRTNPRLRQLSAAFRS